MSETLVLFLANNLFFCMFFLFSSKKDSNNLYISKYCTTFALAKRKWRDSSDG